MKNKFLMLALCSAVLISCEKNNDDDDNGQSEKTNLLVQQTWKFDKGGFDLGSSGNVTDITGLIDPCLTDNTLSFSANGNGTMNEGATKCDAADPQTTSFTWSFASNETMLNIDGEVITGMRSGQFKIVTLSNTELTLSKDTTYQGFPGSLVATFKH